MPADLAAPPPPHCPHRSCRSHADPGPWRVKKKGFFSRQGRPARVQRYLCQHCRRSFSSQTFRCDYWLRHRQLLRGLFLRSRGCSGLRQIAQELDVAHSTVQRQIERLGRHCLLFQERLRPRVPREPLVLDGLRTFEAGHYWPFDLNLLVGVSHYVYGFNDAELRRSGSMRPGQRRHRARLERRHGRPDPQATRRAVEELVGRVVPPGAAAEIRSDEHTSYPRALCRLPGRRFRHTTVSSRAARTPRNPLFPANLADLLVRHGGANHKRQTIAFNKRRQGALYRMAIWVVWRNYVKWSSEARQSPPPAVALEIVPRRLTVESVLARRIFPWQQPLGAWITRCYYGRIPTRCLPRCREHRRVYAV